MFTEKIPRNPQEDAKKIERLAGQELANLEAAIENRDSAFSADQIDLLRDAEKLFSALSGFRPDNRPEVSITYFEDRSYFEHLRDVLEEITGLSGDVPEFGVVQEIRRRIDEQLAELGQAKAA